MKLGPDSEILLIRSQSMRPLWTRFFTQHFPPLADEAKTGESLGEKSDAARINVLQKGLEALYEWRG